MQRFGYQSVLTSATAAQTYLASAPVGNLDNGDLLSYVLYQEKLVFFGNAGMYIASITLSVIDAATNGILPLYADWNRAYHLL